MFVQFFSLISWLLIRLYTYRKLLANTWQFKESLFNKNYHQRELHLLTSSCGQGKSGWRRSRADPRGQGQVRDAERSSSGVPYCSGERVVGSRRRRVVTEALRGESGRAGSLMPSRATVRGSLAWSNPGPVAVALQKGWQQRWYHRNTTSGRWGPGMQPSWGAGHKGLEKEATTERLCFFFFHFYEV